MEYTISEISITPSKVRTGEVSPDLQRLNQLSSGYMPPGPSRVVKYSETEDPFGLLEHRDTYEVCAGILFTECEGLYKILASNNPDVAKQLKSKKNEEGVINFPTVKLGELYSFRMSRSKNNEGVSYTFQRVDRGYEDKGFYVSQSGDNHFVLKNLALGDTDISNDKAYWDLISHAQKWVHDYSTDLGASPKRLREFANDEIKSKPTKKVIGRLASRKALRIKKNLRSSRNRQIARTIFTTSVKRYDSSTGKFEKQLKRRVRLLSVFALVDLIPTSTHTIFAENEISTAVHIVKDIGDIPHDLKNHMDGNRFAREAYDKKRLSLPSETASITVNPEEHSVNIPYDPNNLSAAVSKAPIWSDSTLSDDGDLTSGSIRHLSNLDIEYNNGFDGLNAGDCTNNPNGFQTNFGNNLPNGTVIKTLDTNKFGKGLALEVTPGEIIVCNSSTENLSYNALNGVYIQTFLPNSSKKNK